MEDKNTKIQWLGMDGFLVVLYPLVVGLIAFSIKFKIDFILGRLVPYGTMLVVFAILFKYFSEVMRFSKDVSKK